ncbi:MAG: SOS response-associated peptidase [Actinomycetales bacterium]|nr:SOS response-associated peptidase [Actinomycetales bacterium]
MCGRYAAAKDPAALAQEFETPAPAQVLAADFNVAPTKQVYVVVDRPEQGRSLEIARWGLVPSWAKDPAIGSRLINARAETIASKPAFRGAFAKRRCLVPATGYYEWYQPADGPLAASGKPRKQPFFIHPADGASLAMAGLYEWWRDATRPEDDPAAWRLTCTIITTDATDEVGRIHDRMPMTVPRAAWAQWLDPQHRVDVTGMLAPATAAVLDAYPVSTAVNSVRNNGPELIAPLHEGEE